MLDSHDQELLQRAKMGERMAFDELQGELEPPVRRFVQRLIGQSDLEDDMVQNAFLALYMNLERIDPVEQLRPFLFRIVRNLCYDELRRRGRFQMVWLNEVPDARATALPLAMDHRPLPDDVVHWSLLYAEVQEAMEHLPEMQRQALILYFDEDLPYAQIAEVMASDIGTVKSRIHYGRKNLLKLLRPEILQALSTKKEDNHGANRR